MTAALRKPVLYPYAYGVYIMLAALDVLLTWSILLLGGKELNTVAQWFIDLGGLTAMTFFKFATVYLVLLVCETVGRRESRSGRRLAIAALGVSMVPVGVALLEMSRHAISANQVLAVW